MKQILLAIGLLASINAVAEGVIKTVNNTSANALKNQLPMAEWGTINTLTITGPLGISDIIFLSNVAKATNNLNYLDLNGTTDLLEIPKGAFNGIKSLTSVSLPSSINTIAEKAFMDCTNLLEISFDEGLTTISDRAFCNDSLLSHLLLPSTLGDINISAFEGCYNLKEISVAEGSSFFQSSDGVLYTINDKTLVKYPAAKEDEEFGIPKDVTKIGSNAFSNNKYIKSVLIPSSVKSIGKNAFSNCTGISSLEIGDKVADIADFSFAGCTNLEYVAFPATLKTIGDAIFSKCCKITTIRCDAETPPTYSPLIESPFFSQDASICTLSTTKCVLIVPSKAQSKYQEAKGWNIFTNISSEQNF